MKLCRNCEHWKDTSQWMGNCPKYPFEKDQWRQSTAPNYECKRNNGFVDKYAKYQVAAKEVE